MFKQKDVKKLLKTRDDDLLKEFPGYSRSELRRIKIQATASVPEPRVLLIDIETAPIQAFTWGLFDQNIGISQIQNDWFMLCWSAKWLESDRSFAVLTPREALKRDDKRIVKEMWGMLNEADVVIAHNGDKFDIKKLNARFIKYGLPFPSYYQTIDTLKIARKYFSITSNKLDYLCRYLGLDRKIDTGGFDLWVRCMNGDGEALNTMSGYCINDVDILEELYNRLKTYAQKEFEQIKKRFIKAKN